MHLSTFYIPLLALGGFAKATQHSKLKCKFSGVTVFGDSLSDNGSPPGSAWYLSNHTLPADPNYYNSTARRWSNNVVWTEILAASLGVPLTDYAIGGATSDSSLVPDAPSNELFVVLIGINDALITAQSNLNPAATHTNETELAGASIAAIEKIVSGLEKQGAKNFLLALYPDVSRAPIITSLAAYPTAATDVKEYLTALNSLTLAFYKKLKKTSGVHVSIGDFYSRFNTILDNPEAAGFSSGASVPCVVGTYGQPGYSLCSTDPTQQDTYLFWDHVHPTKNGHQIIAEVAYAGLAATYGVL
ncbi:hypothetical protein FRB95_004041 [Tulasnella sp. JGI-2019a]|nr:hypothetical protein FRB93_002043 [Tulasnella sp. JGI-2019a]KAG9037755.1 hypothetical protein FRB95_004041 [Tulasnella sp. JGI-2019a]